MKKNYILIALGLLLTLLIVTLTGCIEEEKTNNIVETAIANDDFGTLVDAVVAAGLDGTLSDETTEFTVFAPTDDAFGDLDPELLNNLVTNDITTLTSILTYHVVPGSVMSTDLSDGMRVETVEGSTIDITIGDGKVLINNAEVISADIECSNGIIHVIDAVILPN